MITSPIQKRIVVQKAYPIFDTNITSKREKISATSKTIWFSLKKRVKKSKHTVGSARRLNLIDRRALSKICMIYPLLQCSSALIQSRFVQWSAAKRPSTLDESFPSNPPPGGDYSTMRGPEPKVGLSRTQFTGPNARHATQPIWLNFVCGDDTWTITCLHFRSCTKFTSCMSAETLPPHLISQIHATSIWQLYTLHYININNHVRLEGVTIGLRDMYFKDWV